VSRRISECSTAQRAREPDAGTAALTERNGIIGEVPTDEGEAGENGEQHFHIFIQVSGFGGRRALLVSTHKMLRDRQKCDVRWFGRQPPGKQRGVPSDFARHD
jgi:hypothetical protein